MSKIIHCCLSIEGALRTWKTREWKSLAKSNNCSVDQVKETFWQYLRDGKQVIPFGEPCEGFSYINGCQGHEIENDNAK